MISDDIWLVWMKRKWKKRLTGCCSNDLPSNKNDTSETATAKRMTTIMNWQIYACSTHSHGHNNIKRNFRPHKLRDSIATTEREKNKSKKKIHRQIHIFHYNPNSSVVRLCDSWDMEYVKWFAIYEKDTNANTNTHTHAHTRIIW